MVFKRNNKKAERAERKLDELIERVQQNAPPPPKATPKTTPSPCEPQKRTAAGYHHPGATIHSL